MKLDNKKMKKVSDITSKNFKEIKGELLLGNDGYFYIKLFLGDKEYTRKGYEKKAVRNIIIQDYAWMSLEELYEDIVLGNVEA